MGEGLQQCLSLSLLFNISESLDGRGNGVGSGRGE